MDRHDEDDRWDYDCPQFVDFTVPMPFNDGADQMFESTVMGEGPITSTVHFLNQGEQIEQGAEEGEEQNAQEQTEKTVAVGETKSTKKMETSEVTKKKPMERILGNVVTSLEQWKNRGKHASSGPDEASTSKKPRKSAEKGVHEVRAAAATKSGLTRSKSVQVKKTSVSSLCSEKSTIAGGASGSKPLRAHTRTLSRGSTRSRSNSVDLGPVTGESKADNTTGGKSSKMPSLLKRLGEAVTSSKVKSTDELEMERIKQLRKELQHKRQMAQESYKKSMFKAAPVAVHSSKGPTMPQEFRFQTDTRLKTQGEKAGEKSVGDFVKSLRSRTVVSPGPSSSGPKKLTVPHPFHLTEKPSTSSHQPQADSKFQSMAEQVKAFHRQTPERFRIRARSGDVPHKQGSRSISPPRLTQAHTPNLTARNRHRPNHFPSQQDLEEKEIEEMKRNQFKARPVNTKVLSSSNLGIKKVPSKPVTLPEEFALSSGVAKKNEEEEHYEFHANPLNKKIMEGTVGVKPVKPALPTVPMSPAFALKHRVRLPVEVPEDKADTNTTLRAKPVPHTGIPFQPKLPHQHTVPEPFSVEERSKAMLAQKEVKIRQVFEEERKAREFHAQPLPSLEPFHLEKQGKEPTKPEPFQLETDQRGARYMQDLAHKLTEEEEEQRKAAQFRAQPNRIIYKEPFLPAKSTKALTEVSDFELNSDRRALHREEFEMRKKEREVELEGHRRQREQRQKEEEEAAIAKLRAEMVHRSNPVRHYNPLVIKPSEKPITEPESPRFSDRLRAKVRL
ncbi:targeting protein for Xklp2 homolog isoform X2 [Littorina saxatilis]|uniref:Targeting protein for Xklp2-like protein n=1 Tax=Littorina saxatilis TaxID=31220 RepID=A0AAN9GNH3_9CAEN